MGPPRSGTTLIAWLLNQHEDCQVLLEMGLPIHFKAMLYPPVDMNDGFCCVTWAGRECSTSEVWQLGRLGELAMSDDPTIPSLNHLVATLCEAVRSYWSQVRVFGGKCPLYCYHWAALRDIFPEARFVTIERDLDAAAGSYMRLGWQPAEWDLERTKQHLNGYRVAMLDCPDATAFRLEEIEAAPEAEIARLLEAVGLGLDGYPMAAAVDQVLHGKVN